MTVYEEFDYGSANLDFVEALYERYLDNPSSVDASWRRHFEAAARELANEEEATGETPTGTYDNHVSADEKPHIIRLEDVGSASAKALEALRRAPLFEALTERDLRLLAQIAREVEVEPGRVLSGIDQRDSDLFLILEGRVSIRRDGREITWLGRDELVGELAVLDDRPRSAEVVAKEPCRLVHIPRGALHELLRRDSALTTQLLKGLAVRLRDAGSRQERVDSMVNAFRERGHVAAELDPLGLYKGEHPELTLAHYDFSEADLNKKFTVKIGRETSARSLGEIHRTLQEIYCQAIGAQFMHIDDLAVQEWIRERLEEEARRISMTDEERARILRKLTEAEVFEQFLDKKFPFAKRFSLEGSESLIPLLDYAIEKAGEHDVDEVLIGMAHRGRLNVLVNIMDKPPAQVFREFRDVDPELHRGSGDVKYHLGFGVDRVTPSGRKVHLSLCFNPSHLAFVGPVALGRARAKQDHFGDLERRRALTLLIHGDAAFIGQGVVQEMFNLSELEGYRTGGSVHVILNNQIGFTTDPEEGRSSQYATDIARMLQIPIFHVNGEHPEAVALVIRLAMDFREKFGKDVVIDMYGYRKYGHNESDEPAFTQPLMYQAIKKRKTVRQAYCQNLDKIGGVLDDADAMAEEAGQKLERGFEESNNPDYEFKHHSAGKGRWKRFRGDRDADAPAVETAVEAGVLRELLAGLATPRKGFKPHPKLKKRFLGGLLQMADGEKPLDWGAGEALAYATLLREGAPIRLTGQDAERGTFSHRHAVLHDVETGERYSALRDLADRHDTRFEIYNSPLSETAVMAFEYGYSLDSPEGLTIWEAQFGDFCNVAQVIIDQFISSSEEKWRRLSGLTLLLPHGFEGQGPEHSSARLERFLMLSAVDNIQVVNLTTPAQIFHCLRRQALRPWRKPLIVMSPKSLLRHPRAVSSLASLAEGRFMRVIPDEADLAAEKVERVLLCSGKIYYELAEKREKEDIKNTAIVRMEQYYPLPKKELEAAIRLYPAEATLVWVQEEPWNMGAWPFLKLHLDPWLRERRERALVGVTRPESASPATGSAASHRQEQEELLARAFGR